MNIEHVSPYIHLNGTVEKAIQLYERALGAKVESVMRYGDAPGVCDDKPENKDLVLHSALRIGGSRMMLNDEPPDRPAAVEGNVEVALQFAEVEDLEKAFAALAEGGKVTVPPQDMFWGARFGALTDAYGVRWMFNCPLKTT